MYGTILNLTTLAPNVLMVPGVYFIHSTALLSIYLNPCLYMSPALIRINIVNLTRKCLRVNLSANPGNNYKGRLGCKLKCYRHVSAGYSVTIIQQQLKEKDIIVMKRSLYCLINNLRANCWALIIHNNKCPYYHL